MVSIKGSLCCISHVTVDIKLNVSISLEEPRQLGHILETDTLALWVKNKTIIDPYTPVSCSLFTPALASCLCHYLYNDPYVDPYVCISCFGFVLL